MTLDQDTLDALRSISVNGNQTTMPQLDRALYVKVNKALECLGGKWNKKAKAHVWDCDPGDPIADAVTTGEVRDWKKELQFYPTPPELAERVIRMANVEVGQDVLEPSAGDGALVRALRKHGPPCHVVALDLDMKLVDKLKLDNLCQAVYCANFLTDIGRDQFGDFDRVIMNPPFTKGQDVAHVTHAFGLLKPGGRLVAVTAPGWTFRNDQRHAAFRSLVEQFGESEEVEAGAFKGAGTMIRTMIVTLNKPGTVERGASEALKTPVAPSGVSEPAPEPKEAPAKPRKRREAVKSTTGKPPAGPMTRELRAKLAALVERGVNGEATAAKEKLERLETRYDFSAKVLATADIFKGPFHGCSTASPVCRFSPDDWDVGNGIKAAIERAAGIPCVWRNEELLAKADTISARKLAAIAGKVSQAFVTLWKQFAAAPRIHPADRGNFLLGLTDGMLHEEREILPTRPAHDAHPRRKAKAKAVSGPAAIALHPYSMAIQLGRQIRFETPLDTLAGELENTIKGELT